jgi:hypothetical protein
MLHFCWSEIWWVQGLREIPTQYQTLYVITNFRCRMATFSNQKHTFWHRNVWINSDPWEIQTTRNYRGVCLLVTDPKCRMRHGITQILAPGKSLVDSLISSERRNSHSLRLKKTAFPPRFGSSFKFANMKYDTLQCSSIEPKYSVKVVVGGLEKWFRRHHIKNRSFWTVADWKWTERVTLKKESGTCDQVEWLERSLGWSDHTAIVLDPIAVKRLNISHRCMLYTCASEGSNVTGSSGLKA